MTIVNFPGVSNPQVSTEKVEDSVKSVLKTAGKRELQEVLVIGRRADGDFWFSTNRDDLGDMLFMIEVFKTIIMRDCLKE